MRKDAGMWRGRGCAPAPASRGAGCGYRAGRVLASGADEHGEKEGQHQVLLDELRAGVRARARRRVGGCGPPSTPVWRTHAAS